MFMRTNKLTIEEASRRKSGMTLIEVVVASMLLSMVVGGAMAGLLQARYLGRAASHRVHALQMCRSNVEALRSSFGYADSALDTGFTHTNMPSDVPYIVSVGGKILNVNYTSTYTVVETDLGLGARYKTVVYRVVWDERCLGGYVPQQAEMSTVIALGMDR
jgi:prepilin-type N-terminal cleavage/methylation domain-containing protein